jgi:hypothetical protein
LRDSTGKKTGELVVNLVFPKKAASVSALGPGAVEIKTAQELMDYLDGREDLEKRSEDIVNAPAKIRHWKKEGLEFVAVPEEKGWQFFFTYNGS